MKKIKVDREILENYVRQAGVDEDLNFLDVSEIEDFSGLFMKNNKKFNGNISEWDMSNATNLSEMFRGCDFNRDISKWNVSKVYSTYRMFQFSKFNQPLNDWKFKNIKIMTSMFNNADFNQPLDKWNISGVIDMKNMFAFSEFKQDISMWDIDSVGKNVPISKDMLKLILREYPKVIKRLDIYVENKDFINQAKSYKQKLEKRLKENKDFYKLDTFEFSLFKLCLTSFIGFKHEVVASIKNFYASPYSRGIKVIKTKRDFKEYQKEMPKVNNLGILKELLNLK